MLFIDFSSAFNTIIPSKLITKLSDLAINVSPCNWMLDFLTNRPHSVRLDHHTSSTLILNTGVRQGCVLSPLPYYLFIYDCTPAHGSNTIVTTHQQRWVGLQGGGPAPNSMVWQQQLGSQHQEDQRDHRGLWKVKCWHTHTPPHSYQWNRGWVCHQLQVSGCPHLRGPLLDPQHLHLDQEGSPASLLPEETKEDPSVSSVSSEPLPLHHREHPYQLCHSLVWQLLCVWLESTAEGGENCPVHHRFLSPPHLSSCVSGSDVTYATSHVFSMRTLACKTTQQHKQHGGRREMYIL